MDEARQRKIRERAHAVWEREGHPEGRGEQHWFMAEGEIRGEEQAKAGILTKKISIGVIIDWKRGERCSKWSLLLEDLDKDNLYLCKVTSYRLADIISKGSEETPPGFFVQDLDVLIINWDTANGDPEFGGHLALGWLRHRYPEILLWIRSGKLLIIEGQAILSVPSQEAYDALAGTGELPVCGPEDPQNPLAQLRRLGSRCRKTRYMPDSHGFEYVNEFIDNNRHVGPTHDELFPQQSNLLLTKHIDHTPWHRTIYRGWFRRAFPGTRSLRWVSIIKTDDRGFLKNHSTMQVAKVGRGAIFATTMFLATTSQRQLILAMLNCADRNTSHLPDPPSYVALLRGFWKLTLTLSAGAVAGYLLGRYEPLAQAIIHRLRPNAEPPNEAALKSLIQGSFVAVGMGLFIIGTYLLDKFKKMIKDIIGY